MNKEITIYELLRLIKDGQAPNKIVYDNYIWSLTGDDYHTILKTEKEQFLITGMYYTWLSEFLNDKVEIINNEEWKMITDFPNYEISTYGNIRTKEYYDSRNHLRKSKLLEKKINNVGYEYVILSNDIEKHKTLTIHRLVAKTFLDDYYDNLEVNHINGIKTDNRVKNLEMTTHCENIKKRYEIGNDGNNYKAVEQFDLDGNYIATYKSSYEAEKITGIGRTCIGGCCRKEHHTAGGYIWKFKLEEDNNVIGKILTTYDGEIIDYVNGEKHLINTNRKDINIYIPKINKLIDEINKLKENNK